MTGRSDVKREASFRQLPTTDVGQISSTGCLPFDSHSRWMSARVSIVLQSPISSARHAPNPQRRGNTREGNRARRLSHAQGHLHDLTHGGLVCGLPLPEIKRRLDFLGVHLHPLAAHLDERLLELCQGGEFLKRELLVAQGHLPVKLDNRVERKAAPSL